MVQINYACSSSTVFIYNLARPHGILDLEPYYTLDRDGEMIFWQLALKVYSLP